MFPKNSLTAIADDTFGDVGSSSIGVASSFFLVVTLVEDYSNYREEPVKMIVAMLITVSGTAVSVAGAGAIAAIPGVGPWAVVIGGVVWDTAVGMAQDYLKEQL